MTILVTGAGGRIGATVLRQLYEQGRPVRAAGRTQPADLPGGVEWVDLDLAAPTSAARAVAGVEQIFLYARPEGAEQLLKAAADAGLRHIVLLSSLAIDHDADQPGPIALQHLLVERAIEAAGIGATVLRPGAFASNALQWAAQIRAEGRVALPYPGTYSEPVHPDDLAEVAVRAFDDGRAGAVHRITGPQSLSAREQVRAIAAATNRPIEVREIDPQRYAQQLSAHVPATFVRSLLDYQRERDGQPGPVYDVAALLGRPARPFATWAAENAASFS
ncbi:NAD(P)H-binding protein [Micromonospora sp. NPDC049204]|uniref:SDR family oxidoreductase n=1 Tax=Micromonospora sp. NPDC049204 TaxID=3154351 RepID=UPI0033D55132